MKTGSILLAAGLLVSSAALAADENKLTTMSGTVVSTDAQANTVTVQGASPAESVTIQVAPDTKIIKAGKKIALNEIAGGEKVTVNYKNVDGKKQAVSIGVEPTA
jgi:hypothetical protein